MHEEGYVDYLEHLSTTSYMDIWISILLFGKSS